MWLFVGGMMRSGSVLQFNLASQLVENLGVGQRIELQPGQADVPSSEPSASRYHVFKIHNCTPRIADLLRNKEALALYTYRDLRDVAVSLMALKDCDFAKVMEEGGLLEKAVDEFDNWCSLPGVLITSYERLIEDLGTEVARIATHLGLTITTSEAKALGDAYSVENQRKRIQEGLASGAFQPFKKRLVDPRSMLHATHILTGSSGGWKERLTPAQADAIHSRFGSWLKDRGYI